MAASVSLFGEKSNLRSRRTSSPATARFVLLSVALAFRLRLLEIEGCRIDTVKTDNFVLAEPQIPGHVPSRLSVSSRGSLASYLENASKLATHQAHAGRFCEFRISMPNDFTLG